MKDGSKVGVNAHVENAKIVAAFDARGEVFKGEWFVDCKILSSYGPRGFCRLNEKYLHWPLLMMPSI